MEKKQQDILKEIAYLTEDKGLYTLRELSFLTNRTWIFPKLDKEDTLNQKMYVMVCLTGEIGELANKLKKVYRGQNIQQKDISEELADILYYYLRLCKLCNIDPETAFLDKMVINTIKYGISGFTHKDERG